MKAKIFIVSWHNWNMHKCPESRKLSHRRQANSIWAILKAYAGIAHCRMALFLQRRCTHFFAAIWLAPSQQFRLCRNRTGWGALCRNGYYNARWKQQCKIPETLYRYMFQLITLNFSLTLMRSFGVRCITCIIHVFYRWKQVQWGFLLNASNPALYWALYL